MMYAENPKAYWLANLSLFAMPLAAFMGLVGFKGFQSQDNSMAIFSVMGIVLIAGFISGIVALWSSRILGPQRLRGRAVTGIALIIVCAGIMAFSLRVIS